ncbi:hypothetical protein J3R30DRAFT_3714356 [Lentinula aciculospora]|uniref:Secreted protein n=1 Tax=Lentinula aciculospora TaxID=153920 RepID=A0A9W8ZXJ7_9AGAR|nr:hypothetical protein J3R30DRAFT_3714356 [Lentinula aciculospora]
MKLTLQLAISLILIFRVTLAAPLSQRLAALILPRDAVHITLDESTDEFIAFKRDWTFLGRYPAHVESRNSVKRTTSSTCTNLTAAEAQTLSGWDKLNSYADTNWGKGSRNIVTDAADHSTAIALQKCAPLVKQPMSVLADNQHAKLTTTLRMEC